MEVILKATSKVVLWAGALTQRLLLRFRIISSPSPLIRNKKGEKIADGAGNLPGKTQTLPLPIYTAMESDPSIVVAISALLLLGAFVLLLSVSLIRQKKEVH